MHAYLRALPPVGQGADHKFLPYLARTFVGALAGVLRRIQDLPHDHPPLDPEGVCEDMSRFRPEVDCGWRCHDGTSFRRYVLRSPDPDGHVSDHRLPPHGPRDHDRGV